jgi:hypothetical protein
VVVRGVGLGVLPPLLPLGLNGCKIVLQNKSHFLPMVSGQIRQISYGLYYIGFFARLQGKFRDAFQRELIR